MRWMRLSSGKGGLRLFQVQNGGYSLVECPNCFQTIKQAHKINCHYEQEWSILRAILIFPVVWSFWGFTDVGSYLSQALAYI